MTHALPDTEYVPEVIGADIEFLLDGSDGYFRVLCIGNMVETIESDAFYPDDQSSLAGATLYMLSRGRTPLTVAAHYTIYSRDSEWIYKVMKIYRLGELIAQQGYKIPTFESYEKWSADS